MRFHCLDIAAISAVLSEPANADRKVMLLDGDHVELLTQAELDAKAKALAAQAKAKALAAQATPPPISELRLADIWRDADRPRQDRAARRARNRKHNRTK